MNFIDAQQANLAFAVKQSAHIEAQVYKQKYPEYDYASLIPVDYSADEWASSVTYYSMDTAGKADWINANGNDVPLVGMALAEHETGVHTAGIGYDFGYGELHTARRLGIDMAGEKAFAARRAYEQMVYTTALSGDTAKNFQGLFSYTGVPQASVAADGTGSATTWASKTPDQVARDINALLIGIHSATNTVELADTLILPVERFQYIATTRMTDSNDTILQFVQKANVYTAQTGQALTIRAMRGLLTVGAGSTARMIAYRRSPEVLKLHIPMEHQFIGVAQQDVLYFKRPGIFRLGGLDIRLPKAVSYGDGI